MKTIRLTDIQAKVLYESLTKRVNYLSDGYESEAEFRQLDR